MKGKAQTQAKIHTGLDVIQQLLLSGRSSLGMPVLLYLCEYVVHMRPCGLTADHRGDCERDPARDTYTHTLDTHTQRERESARELGAGIRDMARLTGAGIHLILGTHIHHTYLGHPPLGIGCING